MRVRCGRVGLAALMMGAAGCAPAIEVRTTASPDLGAVAMHTFRMLPVPARSDGRTVMGEDPMLSSSIAHRTLRDRLIKAFQGQGYTLDERNADIGVAFYASVHERLDVRLWNYGYPFYPGWYGPVETVTPYPEGTVIVDVVRLSSHELLWRGRGSVEYSDDPTENLNRLGKAADMIVARFPRAAPVMVGERR